MQDRHGNGLSEGDAVSVDALVVSGHTDNGVAYIRLQQQPGRPDETILVPATWVTLQAGARKANDGDAPLVG